MSNVNREWRFSGSVGGSPIPSASDGVGVRSRNLFSRGNLDRLDKISYQLWSIFERFWRWLTYVRRRAKMVPTEGAEDPKILRRCVGPTRAILDRQPRTSPALSDDKRKQMQQAFQLIEKERGERLEALVARFVNEEPTRKDKVARVARCPSPVRRDGLLAAFEAPEWRLQAYFKWMTRGKPKKAG